MIKKKQDLIFKNFFPEIFQAKKARPHFQNFFSRKILRFNSS
jgi:hypothetical protein